MSEITPEAVFEEYQNYLIRIPNGLNELMKNFRDGELTSGFSGLTNLSEGLTWLVNATKFLKISNYDVEFNINKVVAALDEINNALINKDFLLVADILEYELYEYFTELVQN